MMHRKLIEMFLKLRTVMLKAGLHEGYPSQASKFYSHLGLHNVSEVRPLVLASQPRLPAGSGQGKFYMHQKKE